MTNKRKIMSPNAMMPTTWVYIFYSLSNIRINTMHEQKKRTVREI
jgi:hypothetical protein